MCGHISLYNFKTQGRFISFKVINLKLKYLNTKTDFLVAPFYSKYHYVNENIKGGRM
jgi:hypothetical protein